jgi:heat shock protein HslJ
MLATIRSGAAIPWLLLMAAAYPQSVNAQPQGGPSVRLHGHVPSALQYASRLPRTAQAASEPLVLTIMLNWSDSEGFEAFSNAFDDPVSPNYHHPISAEEVTTRFGPTQEAYDTVEGYFQQQGFTLLEGSANAGTENGGELIGRWRLDQLGKEQPHLEKPIELEFAKEGQRMSGFAGCNRLVGGWRSSGSKLQIERVVLTLMFCGAGSNWESKFVKALESVAGYRTTDSDLELLATDDSVIAVFKRVGR